MNDVYLVQANPGGGSHFLLSLLVHLYRQESEVISFNDRGNSHKYAFKYIITQTNYFKMTTRYDRSEWPYQLDLLPDNNGPLVIFYEPWHTTSLDVCRLKEKHPNIKYLFVEVDDKDIMRATAYQFFKQTVYDDPKKDYMKLTLDRYVEFAEKNNNVRKDVSLADLTLEEGRLFLEYSYQVADKNFFNEFTKSVNIVQDSLVDNKYVINFMDILLNKEKVISTLEQMTGKTRTQSLVDSYDKYIDNQYDLLETKIPWLLPK